MTPNRIVLFRRLLISSLFVFGFVAAYSQTVTYTAGNSQHGNSNAITLSQQDIFVTFTGAGGATGMQFNGAPDLSLWKVKINGTPVTTTAVSIPAGGFTAIVHFDATPLNGAGKPFIMPGQTMTVNYTGGTGVGKVQVTPVAGGNYAPSMTDNSTNAIIFNCANDLIFFNQGDFTAVDQCAPVVMNFHQFQYKISLRLRNSTAWNLGNFVTQITWGDGSPNSNYAFYYSDDAGTANATNIDATGFDGTNPAIVLTQRPTKTYPAANPTDCSFNFSQQPLYNGVSFCPGLTQTNIFRTYDTDNANSGTLSMVYNTPVPVNQTTDRVCVGTNVGTQFTDATLLNCRAAIEPLVPNDQPRNIRVVYGSTNMGGVGNIPAISVTLPGTLGGATIPITNNDATGTFIQPGAPLKGIPVGAYAPLSVGSADGNGVIPITSPVTAPSGTTYIGLIKTTATNNQVVGQRLYVRIDYWDVCNKYNSLDATSPAPVSFETYIELVTRPAPLTTAGLAICFTNPSVGSNFVATGGDPSLTAVNWYKDQASVGTSTKMTNPTAPVGKALSFPTSSYTSQGGSGTYATNNANGAYYSVWATQVIGGSNTCESYPVEIVIVQQPDLSGNLPATPTGLATVCNGPPANVQTYTEGTAPPTKSIAVNTFTNLNPPPATRQGAVSLTTENIWSISGWTAGVAISGSSTGSTVDVSFNQTTQPSPSTAGNVSVALRYQAQNVTVKTPFLTDPTPRPANYSIAMNQCTTGIKSEAVTLFGQTVGGTAGPDKNICDGSPTPSITLSGQVGKVLRWERLFNGGSLLTYANTTTTFGTETPPFGPGTYTYYAVVQNQNGGPCAIVNSAPATITVSAVPSQPTITQDPSSTGNPICADGTQKTVLKSSTGGVGVTFLWFKNGVSTGVVTQTITLTTVAQSGTYTVQTFGPGPTNCPSAVSAGTLVTVNPLPTATGPTGGGAVCGGNPAPDIVWGLTGTAPFNLTYTIAGVPTSTTSATNTFTLSGPTAGGAYQMTALTDANGCSAAPGTMGGTATVTIGGTAPSFVAPAPSLSPTSVCSASPTDPVLTFTLDAGQANKTGFVLTYKIDGGTNRTKTFDTNGASLVQNLSAFNDAELNNTLPSPHTLTIVSIKTPFGCLGVFNLDLNFTVNPTPTVPTGAVPGIACSSGGGVALSVADPGPGFKILWSTVSSPYTDASGLGTISGSNNSVFTPTSSATATFFAFKQSTTLPTSCMSTSSLGVTQTQDILPTNVNAGSVQNICVSSATMTALTPVNGTGAWSAAPGITFVSPTSPTTVVNNLPVGTNTLTWKVSSTLGVCTPITTTVDIIRAALPAAFDPTPVLCETVAGGGTANSVNLTTYNDQVTLIVGSANRTITYFSDIARTINVTAVPQNIPNGKIYFTTVKNTLTNCTQNGTITFSINALPAATIQNSQFCEDLPIGSNTHAGINLSTSFDVAITGGAASRSVAYFTDAGFTTPVPTPTNYTLVGSVTLFAKVTNTITFCTNSTTVNLSVKPRPIDNPIQGNTSVCTGSSIILYQLDPTFNPGSSYTWTVVGTPAAAVQVFGGGGTNSANFFVLLKFPGTTGTVAIDVFETLNGCQGNTQHMSIVVNSAPAANVITGPTQVCSNQTTVLYQVATPNITSTYTWSVSGATLASSAGASINVDFGTISPVTITVSETSASGCVGAPASKVVTVSPRPAMIPTPVPAVCSGGTSAYTFTSTVASTYSWKVTSITGAVIGTAVGNTGSGDFGLTFTGGTALTNTSGAPGSVGFDVTPTALAAPGCVGATQPYVLIVNPEPVLVNPQGASICSGQPTNYSILLAPLGLPIGTTFTWAKPVMSDASNQGTAQTGVSASSPPHITDILTNTTPLDIQAVYTIIPTSGDGCPGTPRDVTINVHPVPVGGNATVGPICSDVPINYNLQVQNITGLGNAVNSTFSWKAANNPNVGGESTTAQSSITINDILTNVTLSDQTVVYTVTPTSVANSCTGVPFTVQVKVHPKPVGANANATDICSDLAVGYNLQTSNIDIVGNHLLSNFSWIATANGNVGGESTTAQVGNTITDILVNITNNDQVVFYTVTPSSSADGCPGTPFVIQAKVHPKPVGVNATAPDICSNGAMNYDLQVQNINTLGNVVTSTFSWSAAPNANVGGESTTPQSGGIINDVLTNVTSGDELVTYTVFPTSLTNSCPGNSFTIQVTVHPKPVGVNKNAPDICSDAGVGYNLQTQNVDVFGNGVNSTFTWVATSNASVGGESTTVQSGASLTDVLTNVTAADQTVHYTVTPTSSSNTCAGVPFTIDVKVHPKPVGVTTSAPALCSDALVNYNLQTQNITTLGNGVLTNFSWVATPNGNVSGESTTPQSTVLINDALVNVTGSDQTVFYTVTPTSSANLCVGANFIVGVLVHPKPLGNDDTPLPICSDAAVAYNLQSQNITALGNNVLSTFTWVATPNPNITGESTTIQTTGTISDVLVNVTNSDQTVTYTVTPKSTTNSCVGTPFSIFMKVHPKPVGALAAAPAICSNNPVGYNLQTQNVSFVGNSVPSDFTWAAASNPNVSGESTVATAGQVISDLLINVTNNDQTVNYTVTPTSQADGCVGAPFAVSVLVHPEPVGVTDNAPAICSDAIVNYDLQAQNITAHGNALTSSFSWAAIPNGNVSGESTTPQPGNIITDALTNVTNLEQTVIYNVTPSNAADGCVGAVFQVSVQVHPKPVGTDASASPICSDVAVGYNLQTLNIDGLGNAVNAAFTWVATSNPFVSGESLTPQTGPIITDVLVNVDVMDRSVQYTVTPKSTANNCVGTDFHISVLVHAKPVGIDATAPAICSQASVNYDVQSQNINTLGNGIFSNFSWVAASNAQVSGESTTPQSGALINDVLINVTNLDQQVVYTVTPTSVANNCVGSPAFKISVTVHPEPVGVTTSAPPICSGANANYNLQTQNIAVLGNNLNSNFSWVATPNGNVGGESTSAQSGNIITDVLTNVTSFDQTVAYTVTPSGIPANCVGSNFTISVLVHPTPVGVTTAAPDICSDLPVGYDIQIQNIGALGNGVSSSFTWVAASNASVGGESTGIKTGTLITDVLTNVTTLDQTVIYTVTPTSNINNCPGLPFTVSVKVHPKPVGADANAPDICSKSSVNYDLQVQNINALGNGLPLTTFSWVAISNANVTGESTTPQAGGIINDVLVNVTSTNQIVQYKVTPTSTDLCAGTVFTISVSVKGEPVGAVDNQSICSDDAVNYNLQSQNIDALGNGMAGTTFTWVAAADNPSVTGESLTIQTTTAITDVLNNITTGNQVVMYNVIPTGANGCVGNQFTVSISVEPEPVLNVVPTPVCSGLATNLVLSTDPTSAPVLNYNIISITKDAGLTAGAGNVSPANGQGPNYLKNDRFTNTGSGAPPLKVTYRVEPISTLGCKGNQVDIVVTILPEPVVSTLLDKAVCSDQVSGITLNTNGISVAASTYDIDPLTVVVDAGLVGTPTTGFGLAANAIVNDKFTNHKATPLKVTYKVIPHGTNGCVGAAQSVVLTINPVPVLFNPGFGAVCSSNATNTNPVNVVLGTDGVSVAAAAYKLVSEQYSINGGTTFTVPLPSNFTPFGGNTPVSTSGDINLVRNDMYTNTRAGAVIVRYVIEPTGPNPASCVGAQLNYDVTINPEPILSPGSAIVCSGNAIGVVLGAAVGSATITGYDLTSIFIADPSLVAAGSNQGLGHYTANNFLAADKFTNTTGGALHVIYTIVPTAGTCKGSPQTVDVTINPAPAVASTLNRTVCTNAASGITLVKDPASVGIVTYNILAVAIQPGLTQTAGNTGVRMGVTAGEIVNDKFNNTTNGFLTVTYTVQGVSAAPCTGPTRDIVLTVEPTVTVVTTNTAPDICSEGTTNIGLSSPTTPTAGVISFDVHVPFVAGVSGYSDRSNLSNPFNIADILENTDNVPHTVVYQITPVAAGAKAGVGGGCSGTMVPVSVIVEPKPKLHTSVAVQTVCQGSPTNVTLTTPTYPPTGNPAVGVMKFEITKILNPGGVTGMSALGTQFSPNGKLTETLVNPTLIPQNVIYTLQPKIVGGLGCAGDTVSVAITVNPLPVLNTPANQEVCSQDPFEIDIISPNEAVGGNVVKSWTASVIAGTASGFSNGSGDQIFQSIKNTGTIPAKVRYHITPKMNGCTGTPVDVDVTVDPVPTVALSTAKNISACYLAALSVNLTSPVAGATFSWTVEDPDGVGVPLTGSGSSITDVMNNPAGGFLTYHIIATGPLPTSCLSQETVLTVNAAPQVVATIQNPATNELCLGKTDILVFQLDGQAPFTLKYSTTPDHGAPTTTTLTNVGNIKSITIAPTDTTVYAIVSVTDKNGCAYTGPPQSVRYRVGSTSAAFTIVGATSSCSPYQVTLKYDRQAYTEYTWRWGDGSPDSVYTNPTAQLGATVVHTYSNSSPTSTSKPKISLQAALPWGCNTNSTQTINIFPTIITNVFPDKNEMCSGETVHFTNNSFGVTSTGNNWFARNTETGAVQNTQGTKNASFTLLNNSANNDPLVYEIVYQATNGSCPAPDVITPITVYKKSDAGIDTLTIPPFIGGHSIVTFVNTSTIKDPAKFRYEWDFGLDATPATATGVGDASFQFQVDYISPGPRDITLTVTDLAAEAAGMNCVSTFTLSINIKLLPLIAKYTAVPPESCWPTEIKVTDNQSTGDIMLWKLYDNNGKLSATSNAPLPSFEVNTAGQFTLQLTTSNTLTGQVAIAPVQSFIVYDKPLASFDLRPDIVYVPDTEMSTFNFSFGATEYFWDFGDNGKSTDFQPTYVYKIEGLYTVTLVAANDHGNGTVCSDTLTRKVTAKQGGLTKVPNAFTPNPNGPSNGGTPTNGSYNDIFLPIVKGVEEFNMQIYDRWGNLIFESNSSSVGWDGYNKDGKLMPSGVYVYKLTVRLSDNQRSTQIGDVTMIR